MRNIRDILVRAKNKAIKIVYRRGIRVHGLTREE